MKNILRYGLILGLICLIASGLLSIVYTLTYNRIVAAQKKEELSALKEVIPQADYFQPLTLKDQPCYKAYDKEKKLIGVAFKTEAKGYSSVIATMVGMDLNGKIMAIKVLSQNETPGLGARIVEVLEEITIFDVIKGKKPTQVKKPWFPEQFSHKSIEGLKDIQAITGATISSEAVINSVIKKAKEILELVKNE